MLSIKCALLLGEHLDRPLQEIIGYSTNHSAPVGLLDETGIAQPALFAFEYALAIAVAFVGHRARCNRRSQLGRIRRRLRRGRTQSGRRVCVW